MKMKDSRKSQSKFYPHTLIKKSFTLLESMITMMILVGVMGFLGFNIFKGIEEEKFSASFKRTFNLLQTANTWMLFGSDVTVYFEPSPQGVVVYFEPDRLFKPELIEILPEKMTLAGVDHVYLKNPQGTFSPPFAIAFKSSGTEPVLGELDFLRPGQIEKIALAPKPHLAKNLTPATQTSSQELYPYEVLE